MVRTLSSMHKSLPYSSLLGRVLRLLWEGVSVEGGKVPLARGGLRDPQVDA